MQSPRPAIYMTVTKAGAHDCMASAHEVNAGWEACWARKCASYAPRLPWKEKRGDKGIASDIIVIPDESGQMGCRCVPGVSRMTGRQYVWQLGSVSN